MVGRLGCLRPRLERDHGEVGELEGIGDGQTMGRRTLFHADRTAFLLRICDSG